MIARAAGERRTEVNPMKTPDARQFHKLYGRQKKRMTYHAQDFADYATMVAICAALIWFAYGADHLLTAVGLVLCAFMIGAFPLRHGARFRLPMVLTRPQEVLYSLVHKAQNLKWPFFAALGALLAENVLIRATPSLPHHVELMREIALYLFWAHLLVITAYRTAIAIAHYAKREHVREVLMQSTWRALFERQPSIGFEIVHAYFTGLLTHIVYLVPWYFVILHFDFSMVLMPVTLVAGFLIQRASVKRLNDWFYRDHWLGHNSELDFLYMHGPHHDAIPCAAIAVAGNGFLEGFFRGALAFPIPFYNPVLAALYYTFDVKIDMDLHQYIPGVFPKLTKEFYAVIQHSLHHYGRIEPYGFAINLDQPNVAEDVKKRTQALPDELKYSIKLDEQLTGYRWDNERFRWFMNLVDKYQDTGHSSSTKTVTPH